jgi:hypothetical protein
MAQIRLGLAQRNEAAGRWAEAKRDLRAAVRQAPDWPKPYRRLARLLARREDETELADLLAEAAAHFPDDPKLAVPHLERRLDAGDVDAVRPAVARWRDHRDGRLRAFAEAAEAACAAEDRFRASGRPEEARPRAWWPRRPYPGNVGDVLTPFIIEAVTGMPPRHASAGEGLLMAGSTIDRAGPSTVVWGTGTLRRDVAVCPTARYHAVRGPITRAVVLRSGAACPDVYGDPGLVLPRLYRPTVRPRWRVGLVRHYQHRPLHLRLEGVREIEILRCEPEGVRAFIDDLLACEAIVSSSLHGLILAHAYGVPARWATQ